MDSPFILAFLPVIGQKQLGTPIGEKGTKQKHPTLAESSV